MKPISTQALIHCVEHYLHETPRQIETIDKHSNSNFVYKATLENRSIYLKVVADMPKNFGGDVLKDRIQGEALATTIFREKTLHYIDVPEVLFLDKEQSILGMTDIGENREVLLDVIDKHYEILLSKSVCLANAIASIHYNTRNLKPIRNEKEQTQIESIILNGLLAPGAKAIFPEHWPEVALSMNSHHLCLVHSDLWAKNLLVGQDDKLGLVDFEGAIMGDPAFDVSTIMAVALIPALNNPDLIDDFFIFLDTFLLNYHQRCELDDLWFDGVKLRAFFYLGTFLVARSCGPFKYDLSEQVINKTHTLAITLTQTPINTTQELRSRIAAL